MTDSSAYEKTARLLHKMYPNVVIYAAQVMVLDERDRYRVVLENVRKVVYGGSECGGVFWRESICEAIDEALKNDSN